MHLKDEDGFFDHVDVSVLAIRANVNPFLGLSGWKIDATCEGTTPLLPGAPFPQEIVSHRERPLVP